MQTKKHTAWKKNRKFGDVMGGRKSPKLSDKIFKREHNLTAPSRDAETPIFIMDNPSRDFYFPISKDEVIEVLNKLPIEHTEHLTHIWFQKIKKSDYLEGETFQGSFICGSGVYLIVFHPFPTDLKMRLGQKKPMKRVLNYYKEYTTDLKEDQEGWYLKWTEEKIKHYYLERLLLFGIGNSLNSFYKHYWSKAATSRNEKWADNYVFVWADQVRERFEPIYIESEKKIE